MISVLILTLNEEVNIGDCIQTLPWRDDVHVLDSGSSDGTVSIASALGAKITVRPFDDYATQRNAGLALPFRHDWVVMLDADERITDGLAREIETTLIDVHADISMYRVRRRDIFMGRWLKRSSGYPTWFPRVFKRGRIRVERAINETYVTDGETARLRNHLDHYPLNKGIDWWFERHNRYSAEEAKLLNARSYSGGALKVFTDPVCRRAALKEFSSRLPFRPFLIFAYLYVFRGGFLDGRPGWIYANMRLAYEIMIDAKAEQLKLEAHNLLEGQSHSRSSRMSQHP